MPISITALQSRKSISQDDEAHDQANNIENGIDAAENFFSIFLLFHPGSSSSSGSSATENMKLQQQHHCPLTIFTIFYSFHPMRQDYLSEVVNTQVVLNVSEICF